MARLPHGLATQITCPFSPSRSPITQATITRATSSGASTFALGIIFSGKFARSIGVSTAPGATANPRTPIARPSFAHDCAIRFTLAFAAAYAKNPANGSFVAIDDTFTTVPRADSPRAFASSA